ncbi:MAG: HAMP domain-containing protein [Bacteroidales bacterium]|nr:HAMP domain-containing protein [Bacteroidales bacterium]
MAIKMKICSKLLISVLGTVILIYSVSIAFISLKIKNNAYNDATNYINSFISENANITMGEFNADMITVRTLAQSFKNYTVFPKGKREEIVRSLYKGIFENNPQFYALWDSWELSHIDTNWSKTHGRFVENFWRDGDKIANDNEFKNLDGDSGDYLRLKLMKKESAEEPYFYTFTGVKEDELLMTSFISPILKGDEFIGVVGIDISLEHLQGKTDKLKPYENSYAFLVSNKGIIISHPNKEYINKSIKDIYENKEIAEHTLENIKKGASFSFINKHFLLNKDSYFSFAPIEIGNTNSPWSMGVAVPVDVILHKANQSISFIIIIGIIGLLFIITIIWLIAHSITQPLIKVAKYAKHCSNGDFSKSLKIKRKDEIGELADVLNSTFSSFIEISELAKNISTGDLSSNMEKSLSSRDGDLIISLQHMIGKLRAMMKEISSNTNELVQTATSLNSNSQKIMNSGNEQNVFTSEVNKSMNEIETICNKAVDHVQVGVEKVGKTLNSLKNIISKTKVIENIYKKTNFIAVNASVEAARAGKHGKGFAMVSKEIQKLADQSRIAAIDIDKISQESIVVAEESLETLKFIVNEIQHTSSLITQIINASENGVRNSKTDLVRLQEITNENLLISQEIASNAEQLASNAKGLKSSIDYFNIN